MDFVTILETYFRGERAESLYFILPLSLLSVAFAITLLTLDRSAFAWGVAAVFVVLGLALGSVGGGVGFRTPAQVATLRAELAESKPAFAQKELARMQKVNERWPIYVAAWITFALVGLALRFGLRSDLAQGVGIALVFFAGVGLLIDGFAERRARPYTEALERLAVDS